MGNVPVLGLFLSTWFGPPWPPHSCAKAAHALNFRGKGPGATSQNRARDEYGRQPVSRPCKCRGGRPGRPDPGVQMSGGDYLWSRWWSGVAQCAVMSCLHKDLSLAIPWSFENKYRSWPSREPPTSMVCLLKTYRTCSRYCHAFRLPPPTNAPWPEGGWRVPSIDS